MARSSPHAGQPRYASVLADDPGSAVLTLTSFGMVERSRPRGRAGSPVIALWKDATRGVREIPLESGAQGVLLTACGARATRRSSDGRLPVDNASSYFDVSIHQVRPASPDTKSAIRVRPMIPRILETEDMTILTGWAEAVAEAIAFSPDDIPALMRDAHSALPARALGLPEPSRLLDDALGSFERSIRAATPRGQAWPTMDAMLSSTREVALGDASIERLAHLVLRSRLEHLRAHEVDNAKR